MLGCCVAGDAVRRRVEEQMEELWDVPAQWVVPARRGRHLNGYDHPTRLGADRWVAMIGARHRMLAGRQAARPMVVVMVGTAVTVEAVDAEGPLPGRLHPAGPRHHAARAGAAPPACTCRPATCANSPPTPATRSPAAAPSPSPAPSSAWCSTCAALRRRAGLLHDRRRRLEDGAAHVGRFELVESLIFDGLLEIGRSRSASSMSRRSPKNLAGWVRQHEEPAAAEEAVQAAGSARACKTSFVENVPEGPRCRARDPRPGAAPATS
jgi:type III pantothenate kinase